MTKLDWAAIFAAANILILIVLTFATIAARAKHKVLIGDGGNQDVLRAIRAHGNAAETIPAGLIGLALVALMDATPIEAVIGLGGLFTAGRALHGFGLSQSSGTSPGRLIGMLATVLALLGMAGALVWAALN